MNIKKLALATLAGGVTMWVLAGAWHEIMAAAFYTAETQAEHEGIGIIFLGYIVLAGLMAYVYSLITHKGKPFIEGLIFGMVMGLLWVFPHELVMAGAHGDSITYVFKNAAWHMVEQGVGGIVIAFAYTKVISKGKGS